MQNVSFCGKILYNNITILGDPVEQNTTAEEDIVHMKGVWDELANGDVADFKAQYQKDTPNVLKTKCYELSVTKNYAFAEFKNLFITNLEKKTTLILNKYEFSNPVYHEMFKKCASKIEEFFCQGIRVV